jgi:ribosomal protein S18 acetylase RimI-like enzyme
MRMTNLELSQNFDNSALSTLANGYYKLPLGKLANACVYLDMTTQPMTSSAVPDAKLKRLTGDDAERFRALYRDVGHNWLWASHLNKSTAEMANYLDAAERETFAVVDKQGDCGLLQLQFATDGTAEIVYIGVVEAAMGRGLGRWLLEQAIARAFAKPINRLWLHTCSFDHPKALGFYLRAGFRIYATGFEIMDDPRALGLLPETAAPHVPYVAAGGASR